MLKGKLCKIGLLATLVIGIQLNSFAATSNSNAPFYLSFINSTVRPVFTLSAGAAYAKVGQTETETDPISLYYSNQNTYQIDNPYRSRLMYGGFIGAEFAPINSWIAYQLGIGYYQINAFQTSGILYQATNISMDYDNFNFEYSLQSKQILLQSKILMTLKKIFHPYLLLGAGMSINDAYDYQEEPRYDYSGPAHEPFADNTENSFSYALGVGLDVDMTNHIRVGLGYRFTDLGRYSLGSSPSVASGSSLSESHVYTQEALLELTYLI